MYLYCHANGGIFLDYLSPEPLIDTGGLYILYLSIDLTDHYDHFYDEVCEIERLEGDIGRIFANA